MKSHRAYDTVTLLQRKTPKVVHPGMWPPNSPDLNPVDYSIQGVLQEKVCHCQGIERMSDEGVEAAGPLHHHGRDCTVA